MNNTAKILASLTIAAMLAGSLASCAGGGASAAGTADTTVHGTAASLSGVQSSKVKEEDLDAQWSESASTLITLNGDSASVSGSGATASGSTVTITAAGTYVASGQLSNGQIVVDAPETALVRLVLNGVDISNSSTSPIECRQADKLVVVLADGTQNTLSDTESYVFADETTDEPNATLFSKSDLTINGGGTLTVNAAYNNGIGTKDDLIIVSGTLNVDAPNHAIRGRDSVTVLDGALNLAAGNDGIQSNNNSAEDKGWIELYGGSFTITSAHDGIQAETSLSVYGGEYNITAGGGSANAAERTEDTMGFGGGGMRGQGGTPPEGFEAPDGMQAPPEAFEPPDDMTGAPPQDMPQPTEGAGAAQESQAGATEDTGGAADTTDTTNTADSAADSDESATSDSYKGLKATGDLSVLGGSFTINSADDAMHSNANMAISGGSFTIHTGDDAMHADTTLVVEGSPVINILECYEGLESADVAIKGGQISIVAADDGINAAGGRDNTAQGAFGRDSFTQGGSYLLRIEGGDISITAGADGVDSNGDIEIAGGSLTINMTNYQMLGGDGVLDRDGTLTITGGTILGAGGVGLVTMGPANSEGSSTQPILEVRYSSVQNAGATVELKNASGDTLATFTPTNNFQSVIFSEAGLATGESYTLYTGGQETLTLTLSDMVTTVSDTGEAVSNAQGGFGGGFSGGNRGGQAAPPAEAQAQTT